MLIIKTFVQFTQSTIKCLQDKPEIII